MKSKFIIASTISLLVTLALSTVIFFKFIRPEIYSVMIAKKKRDDFIKKQELSRLALLTPKIKKTASAIKTCSTVLEKESALNHCIVRKIFTDFHHHLTAEIIASYPSIAHIINLINKTSSSINCQSVSLRKQKNKTLLLLTVKCKNNE